jgi:hypothetical protein
MNQQQQIVRQSQIKIAMELLSQREIKPTVLELVVMTEVLTEYITKGVEGPVVKRIKELDNWIVEKNGKS